MKKHNRARNLRRAVQTAGFLLFLYLVGKTVFPADSRITPALLLHTSPLLGISTALALRRVGEFFLLSLPFIVLAILAGRFFCGWLCPLGATLDASEKIFRWRRPSQQRTHPDRFGRLRNWKYYLLALLLITALIPAGYTGGAGSGFGVGFGLPLAYLFDPIVIVTRSFALAIFAPLQHLLIILHADQGLAHLANWGPLQHASLAAPLSSLQHSLNIWIDAPGSRPEPLYYRMLLLTFGLFAGIIALNSLTKRFWCRYLCPLGALLAAVGRWAPVRLRVSKACNECGACIRTCRTAAITEDPHIHHRRECVACQDCVSVCPTRAISYLSRAGKAAPEPVTNLSRRRLLQAGGLGLASVLLLKADWGAKSVNPQGLKASAAGLIRPPGALPEEEFIAACVRCGNCMRVCPTNGLQPAYGEGGLEALGTPVLVPRIGQCTQACNSCGKVCPSEAIQPFTIEDKAHLYLGVAVIDRSLCLGWGHDRICSICAEACPYNAIYQQDPEHNLGKRPVVGERICVGCGTCEKVCPIQPKAAIRVYSYGDKRYLGRQGQKELFDINAAYRDR
jgi:MauM/NapG family ferredoxin protein